MAIPIGTIAGGFFGQAKSKSDRKRQEDRLKDIFKQYTEFAVPSDEATAYTPEQIAQFADSLPMEAAEMLGGTAMEGIALDPVLREAQFQALAEIGRAAKGEFSPLEQARLEQMQRNVARDEKAQRQAIDTQMRRRGMTGSGLELAAKLSNQQAAAERQNASALELEALAQQRALQAIRDQAAQAGKMESEDYRREANLAEARDQIARFNAAQRAGVGQRNVAASRERQLQMKDLEAKNIAARNRAGERKGDLAMDKAKLDMLRRQQIAGAQKGLSEYYGGRARDDQRFYTGMGASIDQGMKEDMDTITSLGGMFAKKQGVI